MSWSLALIGAIIALVLAVCRQIYGYWARRGIEGPVPVPLFGNLFEYVIGKKHFGVVYGEIYRKYPTAKYVGFYKMSTPAILVRDLDVVHNVLVRNFQKLEQNDFIVDEKKDPLVAQNPFLKVGQEWKESRARVTPQLTISKVKSLFPAIKNSCDKLCLYLSSSATKEFEAKELFLKYVTENVAVCAFGLDAGSFDDPNSDFLINSTSVFQPNLLTNLVVMFFPALMKVITVTFVPQRMDRWLRSVVNKVIKHRQDTKTERPDFLQTIMAQHHDPSGANENKVVGNCLMFLTEGTETSAITLTYTFYELAKNPQVQQKLFEEVSSNEFSAESIHNMKYLDQVVQETIRRHSTVFTITRICNSPVEIGPQYAESNKKLIIEPGTKVVIPVTEIHMDPENFEHPEVYDPERFSKENIDKIPKMAFLGFGEGPRLCIGKYFGVFQVKAALASVLSKYRVELSDKMVNEPTQSPTAFILHCDSGVWIKFVKR